MAVKLSLLVIRVADLEKSANFYRALGLSFVREKHGNGPEHYSADLAGTVLELYPIQSSTEKASQPRLGFSLETATLDKTVALCLAAGGTLIAPPKPSPWGVRAVIADPDGHKVELSEAAT